MKKTAGSILADMLLAEQKGATKEELIIKEAEFTEQMKKELGGPGIEVIVSTPKD